MTSVVRFALIVVLAAAFGCGDGTPEEKKKSTGEGKTPPAAAKIDTPAKPAEPEKPDTGKKPDDDDPAPRVEMKTSMGTILLELNRTRAPITVENFLRYVKDRHYDNTIFHRVMKTFMIQGGGFSVDKRKKSVAFAPIKNESPDGLSNQKYTIAMARTGDPDSATAQFYINVVENGYRLDYPNSGGHGYAVFGKVVKGEDVVDRIKDVRILDQGGAFRNCPEKNVVIETVRRL